MVLPICSVVGKIRDARCLQVSASRVAGGTRVWAQDEEVGELRFVLQRATSSVLSVAWHGAI